MISVPKPAFAPRFVRVRAFASISASLPSFVANFNLGRLETPFAKGSGLNLSIDSRLSTAK